MFGAFLFLDSCLQGTLRHSPITTGLAFLPMVATLVMAGGVCTTQLYPRLGGKAPVSAGMLIAAAMAWLTGIGRHSSYVADVLGPLMPFGLGIGATIAPAMNAGTTGVQPRDAGVTSATVNVVQQIGGSIGTPLLNSLAASALTRYLATDDATSPAIRPTQRSTVTPLPSGPPARSSPQAPSSAHFSCPLELPHPPPDAKHHSSAQPPISMSQDGTSTSGSLTASTPCASRSPTPGPNASPYSPTRNRPAMRSPAGVC
ncbi:hypothetical protein [Streptomyces sp. NPDC006309]|uniref:hypothetical protein n=1 Tax=Streptomyces sp. NPDC006309 TaxID=3156749 RepID=UPI0033A35552